MKSTKELISNLSSNEVDTNNVRRKTPFSRTKIVDILTAAINDMDYTPVVKYDPSTGDEITDNYFIEFRKWVKKILEKAGMDSNDASIVLDPTYEIPSCGALYDLFTCVQRDILKAGMIVKLPQDKDFTPQFYAVPTIAQRKEREVRDFKTHKPIGTVVTDIDPHFELKVMNRVPKWVKHHLK